MVLEQLDIHMQKKMNLDTDLIPFTKIYSKWIIDLNVKCKTIKLLEHNIRENLDDLECGDELDTTWKAGSMKESTDILDFIKTINFCSMGEKKRPREWKDKPQTGKKIFLKDPFDKGLLSKIHKELLKLNNKKINNLI